MSEGMRTKAATIAAILGRARRVAVVGASDHPWRPSHGVMMRLAALGYDLVPVNPNANVVLGRPAVPALADVEGPIDLVDVFRREEHLAQVAADAVAVGAPALWLQSGLRSAAAGAVATSGGLDYVEDACLAVEAERANVRWTVT